MNNFFVHKNVNIIILGKNKNLMIVISGENKYIIVQKNFKYFSISFIIYLCLKISNTA